MKLSGLVSDIIKSVGKPGVNQILVELFQHKGSWALLSPAIQEREIL